MVCECEQHSRRDVLRLCGLMAQGMLVGSAVLTWNAGDAAATPDGGPRIREHIVRGLQSRANAWAIATHDRRGPLILYDSRIMRNLFRRFGDAAFRFIRAHEYGHHRRGHLHGVGAGDPSYGAWLVNATELDADCWAAGTLRRNRDFEALTAGLEVIRRAMPAHSFPGAPGARERIANIRNCSGLV